MTSLVPLSEMVTASPYFVHKPCLSQNELGKKEFINDQNAFWQPYVKWLLEDPGRVALPSVWPLHSFLPESRPVCDHSHQLLPQPLESLPLRSYNLPSLSHTQDDFVQRIPEGREQRTMRSNMPLENNGTGWIEKKRCQNRSKEKN